MIRKFALATATALGMLSLPATATDPGQAHAVLDDCFDKMWHTQMTIWEWISDATLESCKLYEKFKDKNDGQQSFQDAVGELSYDLMDRIDQLTYETNQDFVHMNCPYYHGAYNNVEFDTQGFEGAGSARRFPFTYANLCGYQGGLTAVRKSIDD